MRRILLLIVLTLSLFGYGQQIDPYKFTSVIDLYEFPTLGATGNLDAQLPLYTINTKGFELPMSLTYDQMGNTNVFYKGNQFGDAWVLNAAGTISREVRERPSQSTGVIINEVCNGSTETHYSGRRVRIGAYIPDELYYYNNQSVKNRTIPDYYTFSFLGLNGKFTIYNDNGLLKASVNETEDFVNIEIVQPLLGQQINTIYITDKNGYKYKFSSPSNVNNNQYQELITNLEDIYLTQNCILTTLNNGHSLVPFSESTSTTYIKANSLISKQIFNDGIPFWENLEITEIYDKENSLLVSFEYDEVNVSNADASNKWVNGIGLIQSYKKLFIKKINILNQGSINFNNIIGTNHTNLVNSYTSYIEVKDLKNNLIKRTEFGYEKQGIHNIKYIKDYKDGSHGLSYDKRLVSFIKEYNSTSANFLQTTIEYKNASVNNLNTVIDRYGYLTNIGYCKDHLSLNDYKADSFTLQKIKHPTGGTVLYDFEPNNFSNGAYSVDYASFNYDNFIYEHIGLIPVNSNTLSFTANEGDHIYILNLISSNNLSLYKSNDFINSNLILSNITNKEDGGHYQTLNSCKHFLSNVVLPAATTPNTYYIKYSGSSVITGTVKAFRFKVKPTVLNYRYAEGNRISKIGYFSTDVDKDLLNTQNGESLAEKIIKYNYEGNALSNSSSGRVRNSYVNDYEMKPFNVVYDNVTTTINGIGRQFTKYTFPVDFNWSQVTSIRTDVAQTKIYDNLGQLLSESSYEYTYDNISPEIYSKPFILSSSVNTKIYEGTNFTTSTASNVFDAHYRQLTSSTTEDNLGTVTKSEFDYDVKGNKIVNTQQRNYIDNNLTEQLLNTYGTTGDFIKTEFKTPEMSAYEKVGNENNKHIGGLVRGYVQPDGTPVTLVYGYLDTQVIAKMVNVDANLYYDSPSYQTIRTNLDVYSTQWHANYSEASLKTALNSLRTTFPNALITTYTYKPMVGVSSVTDENGKTTTYEYDTFNRLATVKDYLGNILKEYQYNFTN